jgi:hypothetical protein
MRRLPAAGGSGRPTGTNPGSSASARRRTITGHPRSAQLPTSGRSATDGQWAKADAQASGATRKRSCRLPGGLDVGLQQLLIGWYPLTQLRVGLGVASPTLSTLSPPLGEREG